MTTVAGGLGAGDGVDHLHNPSGIVVSPDGTMFIADRVNHRVQRVSALGISTTVAGGNGSGSDTDQLHFPYALALDTEGSIYIADGANHRIVKVAANGDSSLVAGTGAMGSDEGQLALPSSIGLDSDGSLYITDTINNRVQKLTAAQPDPDPDPDPSLPAPTAGSRELLGVYANMSGTSGSAARLYMAVLNRQPDAAGHSYWVDRLAQDSDLGDVVDLFVNSPEFSSAYDTLDDAGFVELLYRNVMDRDAESDGKDYWIDALHSGNSRSAVVLHFSESVEFRSLTRSS